MSLSFVFPFRPRPSQERGTILSFLLPLCLRRGSAIRLPPRSVRLRPKRHQFREAFVPNLQATMSHCLVGFHSIRSALIHMNVRNLTFCRNSLLKKRKNGRTGRTRRPRPHSFGEVPRRKQGPLVQTGHCYSLNGAILYQDSDYLLRLKDKRQVQRAGWGRTGLEGEGRGREGKG